MYEQPVNRVKFRDMGFGNWFFSLLPEVKSNLFLKIKYCCSTSRGQRAGDFVGKTCYYCLFYWNIKIKGKKKKNERQGQIWRDYQPHLSQMSALPACVLVLVSKMNHGAGMQTLSSDAVRYNAVSAPAQVWRLLKAKTQKPWAHSEGVQEISFPQSIPALLSQLLANTLSSFGIKMIH